MSTTSRRLPDPPPTLQLVTSELLSDFPSGSAISYNNGMLYVSGDDAANVRVLDTNYRFVQNIAVFKSSGYRISKTLKTDPEASEIITENGSKMLVLLGSGSTNNRNRLIILPVNPNGTKPRFFSTALFNQRVKKSGVREINFEGLAFCRDTWVLANRGNNGNPNNYLVFTQPGFWSRQAKTTISQLRLPGKVFTGISGLEYGANDRLYFTASTEESNNAFEDGAIGDSYIGWIDSMHHKAGQKLIEPDVLMNLKDFSAEFNNQKIEGICIEHEEPGSCTMHLVADNDKGNTNLFKVMLNFRPKN